MKKGILIFAHNSRDVDYAQMSIVSAGLAKKHLDVPVSLVTDKSTIKWLKISKQFKIAESLFENIIEIDRPDVNNFRKLNDGNQSKTVPFINSTRASAWDLTPYDRTLLIDSDFLIFSNTLNEFWNHTSSFLISSSMNDILGNRYGVLDRWTSDEGVQLCWATTLMFTKNQESKLYFDMVDHIKKNYSLYSEIYRFDPRIYRNDIAFSIAKHIISGFTVDSNLNLPPILTAQDTDLIARVTNVGLKILIKDKISENMVVADFSNRDIHVMNKQDLVRNYTDLIRLI
jgi:hypothetical protein